MKCNYLNMVKSNCVHNVCKPGSDGRRLVALKFVAATILLYTPDPSGSSEPPSNHSYEGIVFFLYLVSPLLYAVENSSIAAS